MLLVALRSRLFAEWMKRIKGVAIGTDVGIHGLARVKKAKGATITLGKGVTLTSSKRTNPLLSEPVILSALTPQSEISIGDYAGLSGVRIVARKKVSIGSHTVVGPGSVFYDSSVHHYDEATGWRGDGSYRANEILVGERCYIGMRCIILKGVSIGDRCVVAAGTVVDRDIPAGHLAKGNPMSYTPLPTHRGGPQ